MTSTSPRWRVEQVVWRAPPNRCRCCVFFLVGEAAQKGNVNICFYNYLLIMFCFGELRVGNCCFFCLSFFVGAVV